MKKMFVCVFMFLFLLVNIQAVPAQEEKKKGASENAYKHANENSIFNRAGDWFATIGKTDEEKAKIKEERNAEREMKRAEKKARKEMKRRERENEEAMGDVDKEARKMKKKKERTMEMDTKQFKSKMKKRNR